MDHRDLAVLVDHVGRAGCDARMRSPGNVIRLLRLARCSRDRESAAAFLYRKVLERRYVVGRHADHLRARLLEVADRLAERVRLGCAARGKRLREEVEDDRAMLQLLRQVELELLAPDCSRRGEVWRLVAGLERGDCWACGEADCSETDKKMAHDKSLLVELP